MTATAVIEILVSGLVGLAWLYPSAVLVLGPSQTNTAIQTFLAGQNAAIILALGFIYCLGALVDRIADYLLINLIKIQRMKRFSEWLGKLFADADIKNEGDRMRLLVHERQTTPFLAYLRSTVRIARAATFNSLLIAIFATIAAAKNKPLYAIRIAVFAVVAIIICFIIYSAAEYAYRGFLKLAAEALPKTPATQSNA